MSPAIPHLTNECLETLGSAKIEWPNFDEEILKENKVKIVIQINGKKRGLIETKQNINEKDLLSIINKDEKLKKYLIESEIKKKIYIKDKLINLII